MKQTIKKRYGLALLTLLVGVSACESEREPFTFVPLTPFEISVNQADTTEFLVDVQFKNQLKYTYVLGVVDTDSASTDQEITQFITKKLSDFKANPTRADEKYVYNTDASINLNEYWDLAPNNHYWVVAIGYNLKGQVITNVEKVETELLEVAP